MLPVAANMVDRCISISRKSNLRKEKAMPKKLMPRVALKSKAS
jgi:hypothetical protein